MREVRRKLHSTTSEKKSGSSGVDCVLCHFNFSGTVNAGEHTMRLFIYKQNTHKPHLVSLFKNIRNLTMTLHGFPHSLPCRDANEITYDERTCSDSGSSILAGLVRRDWLTEWLASWQTRCGKVWTGLLWGKVGKNLSCLLCWLGNAPEKGEKETQTKRMWTG